MGMACLKFHGENFHRWLYNCEIPEGFLPSKFPAIQYSHLDLELLLMFFCIGGAFNLYGFSDTMHSYRQDQGHALECGSATLSEQVFPMNSI